MDISSYPDLSDPKIEAFLANMHELPLSKMLIFSFGKKIPESEVDLTGNSDFERQYKWAVKAAQKYNRKEMDDEPPPLKYVSYDDAKYPVVCVVDKTEFIPWVHSQWPIETHRVYKLWSKHRKKKSKSTDVLPTGKSKWEQISYKVYANLYYAHMAKYPAIPYQIDKKSFAEEVSKEFKGSKLSTCERNIPFKKIQALFPKKGFSEETKK